MSHAVQPSSPAERARSVLEACGTGTLSTLAREPMGHPYGSLVTFALDGARPVFLLSELAEHTKNLRADARASLLVAEPSVDEPLARGRATLLGSCRVTTGADRERAARVLLARFPAAAAYAGLGDFQFWSLQVSSVRFIGGFASMSWIDAAGWHAVFGLAGTS